MDNNTLKVNPLKYPNITCDKCGNQTFNTEVILKKIPGFVLGTGTDDQILDLPVFVCSKCGAIFKEYRELYKLEEFEEQTMEDTPKSSLIF